MYRDPWHLFTSFFPYLLLAPSFTNVLNVYAFCNLHDVSWGTKGSDKAEALPSVSSKKNDAEAVVEDITHKQEDVDAAFKETVTRAITKIEVKEVPEKPTMDDENSELLADTRILGANHRRQKLSVLVSLLCGCCRTQASPSPSRI